jgi:hypothetical protein
MDPAPLGAIEEAYAILLSRWSWFNTETNVVDVPQHIRTVVVGPAAALHEALTTAERAVPGGEALTL